MRSSLDGVRSLRRSVFPFLNIANVIDSAQTTRVDRKSRSACKGGSEENYK